MKNYTDEQEAIRQALANFLGSLIINSMYEDKKAKENAIAIICEELTKYIKNEDNTIDIISSKPILKATLWILQKRKEEMINQFKEININITNLNSQYTKDIDILINYLNDYISKIEVNN